MDMLADDSGCSIDYRLLVIADDCSWVGCYPIDLGLIDDSP